MKQVIGLVAILLVHLTLASAFAPKHLIEVRSDSHEALDDPKHLLEVISDSNEVLEEAEELVEDLLESAEENGDDQHSLELDLDDDDYYNFTTSHLNLRPIIGILTQEPGRKMKKALKKHNMTHVLSYLAASYVKSFESAGARIVPIMINKPDEYYEMMANSLNGIVFPGGAAKIDDRSGYGRAGRQLYKHVMESNRRGRVLPLWATCLGFEMLMYNGAGGVNPLSKCSASNTKDTLIFREDYDDSPLFRDAPDRLIEALKTENITSNFHIYCVLPDNFTQLGLHGDFEILSTSLDKEGLEYISTVEHRSFPVFGVQWHPEKPAYEWRDGLTGIPHSKEAIEVNNHLMGVYMDYARLNHNKFTEDENQYLIYQFTPFAVQQIYRSSFLQVYFFTESD